MSWNRVTNLNGLKSNVKYNNVLILSNTILMGGRLFFPQPDSFKLSWALHICLQESISRVVQSVMAIANSWIRNPKIKNFDLLSSFLISSKILRQVDYPRGTNSKKLLSGTQRWPFVCLARFFVKNYWRKILVHFKGNFLRKITELFVRATQVLPSLF